MACPVCFAPTDPTATASLNLGIFVLLGVTAVVLAGFIRFVVSIGRLAGREGPPYVVHERGDLVGHPQDAVGRASGATVGRAFTARHGEA